MIVEQGRGEVSHYVILQKGNPILNISCDYKIDNISKAFIQKYDFGIFPKHILQI